MEEVLFEVNGAQVVLEGPQAQITINGLGTVYVREGTWMEKGEDGEFYPDFSLTWFYKDEEHPEDYLYYEQDPPEVAVYNLTRAMALSAVSGRSYQKVA